MPDVIVIGDGPGGLSAALFLAKNKMDTVVYGQDTTAMNYALLNNYLGIAQMLGSDFQKVAREQVARFGARLRSERVQSVAAANGRWNVTSENNDTATAKYLILSEGKAPRLALQLGLVFDEATGIATDKNARTRLDTVYVRQGALARPGRSQAVISAGDGAAAAIDILSREKSESFLDWDEPPKS